MGSLDTEELKSYIIANIFNLSVSVIFVKMGTTSDGFFNFWHS